MSAVLPSMASPHRRTRPCPTAIPGTRASCATALALLIGCSGARAVPGGSDAGPGASAARLALAPCRVAGLDEEVQCGTYEVFEDRDAHTGRRIGLHVVVLPATGAPRAPDPVFVLQGGPGQAASHLTEFYGGPSFAATRRHRDIVLVDQRGTGASNGLDCDPGGSDADPQGYLGEMFPVEGVRACRRALEQRADLRLYTTPIAMADLDDVRAALGYERINLYGTSYGTRAAMVYARAHPDRVRSLVLKGVVGPGMVLPVTFAEDVQRALELLLGDCAEDVACHAAYPHLRADLDTVLARLDRGPLTAVLRDSAAQRTDTLRLSRGVVTAVIRGVLQSTSTAAQLPLMIHEAAAGDAAPLARMALLFGRAAASEVSRGMFFSVSCTEDAPLIDRHEAAERARGTALGTYWVDRFLAACAEWPKGTLPADYRRFEPSPVPVLFVSGYLDDATPPHHLAEALRLFPNGRSIVVRNGSHSFAGMRGCVDLLIAAFYEAGSAAGLDDSCTARIPRPPFAVDVAQ